MATSGRFTAVEPSKAVGQQQQQQQQQALAQSTPSVDLRGRTQSLDKNGSRSTTPQPHRDSNNISPLPGSNANSESPNRLFPFLRIK